MKKVTLISTLMMLAGINSAYAGEIKQVMQVHGAVCASCAYGLEKKFKKMDGVKHFDINLKKGLVSICTDENLVFSEEQLTQIFIESGYSYKGKKIEPSCDGESSSAVTHALNKMGLNKGDEVSLSGLFNGVCDDGKDFYLVVKSEVIEVIPPQGAMPNLAIGTPLNIKGIVVGQSEEGEVVVEASFIDEPK
jgi:copper chaperone CopZ